MTKIKKIKSLDDGQYLKDNFIGVSYTAEFSNGQLTELLTDDVTLIKWGRSKGLT